MEKKYVLALDQGTTSSRAIIFDKDQKIVAMAQKEFTQIYPKEGCGKTSHKINKGYSTPGLIWSIYPVNGSVQHNQYTSGMHLRNPLC